jgi:hypothetical protein
MRLRDRGKPFLSTRTKEKIFTLIDLGKPRCSPGIRSFERRKRVIMPDQNVVTKKPEGDNPYIGLLIVVLIVVIGSFSWPVSGYLLAGYIAWLMVKSKKNVWAMAAASVLVSVDIGLAMVAIVLSAFNIVRPEQAARDVALIEKLLLCLDKHLPVWTRIPAWAVIIILAILTVLSYFLPTLKLVSRFVWLKRRLGQAVASIAVVTSFTFFSNAAIFEPKSHETYDRLSPPDTFITHFDIDI